MDQLPVAHESDSEIDTKAELNRNDHPDIIKLVDIIDFDKVARLTFIVGIVLFIIYASFLDLAVVVDWPVVSTGLSVSSLLSGTAVGVCMVVELVRP